ncbi:MAG TPA: hypothetical protein VFE13_11285 [Caulobacteraceae bacterium]|nr:hypothetical protein [Caulobacteraceae bacterium]
MRQVQEMDNGARPVAAPVQGWSNVAGEMEHILSVLPPPSAPGGGMRSVPRRQGAGGLLRRQAGGAAVVGAVLTGLLGLGVGLLVGGGPSDQRALRPLPLLAPASDFLTAANSNSAGPLAGSPNNGQQAPSGAGRAYAAVGSVTQRSLAQRPASQRWRAASAPGCVGSRCSYRLAMQADRRLRSAYARALRGGASREQLAAYNGRWWRLRMAHGRNPTQLVAGYGRLAREIEARRRPPRRRAHPSFLRWIEARFDW